MRVKLSIRTPSIIAVCISAAIIASCGSLGAERGVIELTLSSGDELLFPRQVEPKLDPDEVEGTALAQLPGRLDIVGECLVVEDAHFGETFVLIWPPGYSVDLTESGIVHVRDLTGRFVGAPGDDIEIYGAETDTLDGFGRIVTRTTRQAVERRCPGHYWIVGGVSERANPSE